MKKNIELNSAVTTAGASIGSNSDVEIAKNLILDGMEITKQPSRQATNYEFISVLREMSQMRELKALDLLRNIYKYPKIEDAIMAILKNSSISVTRTGFDEPLIRTQMIAHLQSMIKANQPIILALLMGGGKVGNMLKVGQNYLPDIGDLFALSNLGAVTLAIRKIYSPGAKIVVIPDAMLHTADLGMSLEETLAYASAIEHDLALMKLSDVFVPNVISFLDEKWVEGTHHLLIKAKRLAGCDMQFAKSVRSQIDSLVYSINTRSLGWSYKDSILTYGTIAGHIKGVDGNIRLLATELYRRSEAIVYHYIGVNWAIRKLNLVDKIVEQLFNSRDYLRMSVHAKPLEPRPALFTPSSHFPSLMGLLPMHAVGVRLKIEDKIRTGLAFDLTARLRNWIPVEDRKKGRLLWYEATLEG